MTISKTSFSLATNHRQDKRFLLVLIGLTVLLFSATFLGYFITQKTLEREKLKIFNLAGEKIQEWVEERMFHHVVSLRGLQAFWAASSQGVTREEFSTYLNSLNLLYQYPGLSSVIYVQRVGNQLIVTYIEPLEGREAALGYDVTSDPVRKALYSQAADTGKITASDKITLITTNQPGFFLIAPLFPGGVVPESIAERRDSLTGFVALVFRDTQVFKAIFGEENPFPDIDFAIYDSDTDNPDHLLFDSEPDFTPSAFSGSSQLLQTKKYLVIGENPWVIIITAKPGFGLNPAAENLPLVVLASGLLSSVTLCLIVLLLYRQHLKTWH